MPVLNDREWTLTALPTGHYGYSATRIEDLGAAEYTLVTIVCDTSGSVGPYREQLEDTLGQIVRSCRLSPRVDNLMLRVVKFDSILMEIHGFRLLPACQPSDYAGALHAGGSTALYDAAENAVAATVDYAQKLSGNHLAANAIVFVLTDGEDNASRLPASAVKAALSRAVAEEALQSVVSILIGVNVSNRRVSDALQRFHREAGITQYVEIGAANPNILARLAQFVSKSISLQSQSLGTGGPSRSLTF